MTRYFEGVVALVMSTDDKVDISRHLEMHGARLVSRMCKSVTHIIYGRNILEENADKMQNIEALRNLFQKIQKVGTGCFRHFSQSLIYSKETNLVYSFDIK